MSRDKPSAAQLRLLAAIDRGEVMVMATREGGMTPHYTTTGRAVRVDTWWAVRERLWATDFGRWHERRPVTLTDAGRAALSRSEES